AGTLLQDFMEIDRYLVYTDTVFSYLSAIQEMNHWAVAPEKTPMIKGYLKFWEKLQPLYDRFSAKLLAKGEGHQGLLYKLAVQRLPDYLEHTKGKRFIFAGFNALNQAEGEIIQSILSDADADIYWDSDPYFLNDPIHDAGFFMRQYFSKWPYYTTRKPKGPQLNFLNEKEIRIVGIPKQVSQAKYVGDLLRDLQADNKNSLDSTALILADEDLLNPILHALPAEITPVNITMGYPLRETTAAGLFIQWLDLFIAQDKAGWYVQRFLEFLAHPAVQELMADSEANEAAALREHLVKNNTLFVKFSALRKLQFRSIVALKILFSDKRAPEEFLNDGQALLKELRQKESIDPISMQGYLQMEQVLLELKASIKSFPHINDLKALKSMLLELLGSKSVDFVGNPGQGLQIMGMLESRNLDFETVIITSVNEGILPAGKTVNSFIPFDVKRELGLPTYKEKDAVYTYHFYRILQRAKKVILCYNTEPDVLEGGEMSRLIFQLTTDPNTVPFVKREIATPKVPLKDNTTTVVHKDPLILDRITALCKKGFSPTALTDYIRDPLTFLKRHILGIQEPEEVEESLEARTFGTIIHNGLEVLYKPFLGQLLAPEALEDQRKKIRPLVLSLMSEQFPGRAVLSGKNLIASEVIAKYLDRFIEMEIELSKEHEIRILALEQKFRTEYPISGIPQQIILKGTLDRIDQYDGQIRILDYKTGTVKTSEVEIVSWDSLIREKEQSKAFQLLCYTLLYGRENSIDGIQAGIIPIKNPGNGPIKFATKEKRNSRTKDSWITKQVIQEFEDQLQKLIAEICDPEIPFTEKTS
ncbi:MAG: PD-(D/E)XK nuclease family protein, partial [Eudoraea sp.]|nr:PD-(D/E)XK nuclease family protein [Eudoraea sp.]